MAKPSQPTRRVPYIRPEQLRWARNMTTTGVVCLAITIVLQTLALLRPSDWRLDMALQMTSSFASVAAFCSFGIAAVAFSAPKLTDRSLKKIDFVWMSFAGLGLALTVGQTLASSNEILRSEFERQLDSYRLAMGHLTDAIIPLVCDLSTPSDKQLCDALHGASMQAMSVVRVPTAEQAEVICAPRRTVSESTTAVLARLCGMIQNTQGMKASLQQLNGANEALRFGLLPLWQIILSIALGLRLAKSVVEVGWLPIGPPAQRPAPRDRRGSKLPRQA